jgi:predicted permease
MVDIKFALRAFSKTPGFTIVVILTLALGVGATTAIFSVVNAVLLKPLPYANADRLVVGRVSIPDYKDLKSSVDAFEDTAVWGTNVYHLRSKDSTEQVMGAVISSTMLSMLGVDPLLGRTFTPEDAQQNTVVLGYGLWQSRFGGDPSVLGRSLDLSGMPHTIVGVAPAWFSFPTSEFNLWVPIDAIERTAPVQANNRALRIFNLIARLKPGVTLEQAQAQATARSAALATTYPTTNENVTIRLQSLEERLLGNARPGINMLLATVALLLLIACANVANLMLARTSARERELAIRSALGAGRARLVRQVLTESLVLAVAGGLVGLLVATWGVDALPALLAGRIPARGHHPRRRRRFTLRARGDDCHRYLLWIGSSPPGGGRRRDVSEGNGTKHVGQHSRPQAASRHCSRRGRARRNGDCRIGAAGPQFPDAQRARSRHRHA